MNYEKNIVSYGLEYFEDVLADIQHRYKLYYIVGRRNFTSKEYSSYSLAFDAAVDFSNKILNTDRLTDAEKIQIISSLQVLDCDEEKDVITAELKNLLLDKIKDLR